MQREIKNKTISYGIVAVLLACILTATVYNFGVQPLAPFDPNVPSDPSTPSDGNSPSEPNTPSQPNDPSMPNVPNQPIVPAVLSELHTFSSYEELESFINENVENSEQLYSYDLPFLTRGVGAWDSQTFGGFGGGEAAPTDYSTTNVQVAGVDEADFVKSDGEYLYVVSGSTINIVKAYPADEAEVVSTIELGGTYDAQLYVNGDKLAVLSSYYSYLGAQEMAFAPYNDEMFIQVYDITDRANPVLSRNVTLDGTLTGSRMIGDYIYAVVNQAITITNTNGTGYDVILPTISGDYTKQILATEISYINTTDSYYRLTTILAVNIIDDAQEPTYEPFLTGQASEMYVSLNNMYLVVPNTQWYFTLEDGETEPREETLVYRIALYQEQIVAMNEGTVFGYVNDQFSMDEYDGFFRIATTTNNWWTDEGPTNNLYVMNMSLNIVGSLEGLAEGETIYSARFMGKRGYIVTFKNTDPLFVIDLTDPTAPTELGYLKVSGYSDYLHPYDENHIIGIGKETEASGSEDFAWYQGVKISLFDVSNVSNPIEVSEPYVIGDRGTDSPVLSDHKAVLFDKEKNLLVIPVRVAEIDESKYPASLYPDGVPASARGDFVWQGAYVFDISPEGITLRGTITHIDEYGSAASDYSYFVERALYIENVLYTVSDKLVKLNNLESLFLLKEIELS